MLTGKLQEGGVVNGNGRVYPPQVLMREVKNYQKLVKEKQAEWESIEDQFMMEGAKDSEKNQADEIRKQLGL